MRRFTLLMLLALAGTAQAANGPMTADQAVQIALRQSSSVIQADASVMDARSGLWSAYSQVLPHVSGDISRTQSRTGETATGLRDVSSSGHSYGLSGSWGILDLSSWTSLGAAQKGATAARWNRAAARSDVVLATKRQFYEVVKSMHLSRVSTQALRLSRDDERRVRALFEVGSVSKSDLLKARVRTSQSELDSLVADHAVTVQRIRLATQLGMPETGLGEVDSTLTASRTPLDAAQVLADARNARPDIKAVEAELSAASLRQRSAELGWLPYVSASASYTPSSFSGDFETKRIWSTRLGLNFTIFDGMLTESRVLSARAGVKRARETRDAVLRNLESDVHQTLLGYQEATEREALARRTLESASENLNLVQQKYNVGSATILDLIDSQVQLQRAQSDLVSALAAIRVAEATLDQVRGRGE